jgi:hypothetical protein
VPSGQKNRKTFDHLLCPALDYKFCLTIDSKLGTARLARERLARKNYLLVFNRKKLGLLMMRLQREDGTRRAIAESPKTTAAENKQ